MKAYTTIGKCIVNNKIANTRRVNKGVSDIFPGRMIISINKIISV